MPGAAREPEHCHMIDNILFKLEEPDKFYIAICKVCGHYLIVSANKPEHTIRVANYFETLLLKRIQYGPPIEIPEYYIPYTVQIES